MILFSNCADGDKRLAGMAQRRPHGARHVRTGLSQDLNLSVKFVCYSRGLPAVFRAEGPFAGIAAGLDGTLYLSADAEGSVLALGPEHMRR
jgi:hypothetical protein